MPLLAHHLPYRTTGRFQPLVLDYLDGAEALGPLYRFSPDEAGLAAAVAERTKKTVDRAALTEVLREQYRGLPGIEGVEANIAKLERPATFTVCAAHQPNLATGYLYFVYKILHAIKLCQVLKEEHPGADFVPVYYMGSEDADLEELGTFRYGDQKFVWETDQRGAVGRMTTKGLEPLLDALFNVLGPPGDSLDSLIEMLQVAYLRQDTVARATRSLVHALFGAYGLLILDPDDARLKRNFLPVMEAELFGKPSEQVVRQSMEALTSAGYKAQAHPRAINLFYLRDDIRARIERAGSDHWIVVDEEVSWDESSLRRELTEHPERFSPNVILRPLYQETILPDVAFIGGGAEVSYWLQLAALFETHGVFYPAILLRQSVMWMNAPAARLHQKTGLSIADLFRSPDEAARDYVTRQATGEDNDVAPERAALQQVFETLRRKAAATDVTLERSAGAALSRMERQLQVLEDKMIRARKRRHTDGLSRLARLQSALFPGGGLAERQENFMPYYLQYGPAFFDVLLREIEPLQPAFLVIEDEEGT